MPIPAYNPVALINANIITFIVSDPLGVGFAAIRTANPGADAPLITAATTVSPNYQVPSSPMAASDFQKLYDSAEFATFTTALINNLQLMYAAGNLQVGDAAIQAQLNTLLADYPKSLASVKTKYTRNGHAWEYYFGVNASAPTTSLLDNARNGPPTPPNF